MDSHALRKVTKEGAVSAHPGNGETGFTDGQGVDTLFKYPLSVVVAASGDFILSWNVGGAAIAPVFSVTP